MLKFKDLYIAVVSDMANQSAKPGPKVYLEGLMGGGGGGLVPAPPDPLSLEIECPNQPNPSTPCCDPAAVSWVVQNVGQNAGGWMQFDIVGPAVGKHLPLKDYLTQELAKAEINVMGTQRPQNLQSVEEITKLERKLNGALQELAARKAELQKKTRAAQ